MKLEKYDFDKVIKRFVEMHLETMIYDRIKKCFYGAFARVQYETSQKIAENITPKEAKILRDVFDRLCDEEEE